MKSVPFSIYRVDTGEIVTSIAFSGHPDHADAEIAANVESWGSDTHAAVLQPSNGKLQYVVVMDGEANVVDKPTLHVAIDKTEIAADGEDVVTFTGMPDPCTIIIDDDDPLTPTTITDVEGGGFTFSTEDPGPYSFEVRGRFPFLPWKAVVLAT